MMNRTLNSENRPKKKGRLVDWKNLYFPIGCGMMKGGVPPDVPLVQQADGSFLPVIAQKQFFFRIQFLLFRQLMGFLSGNHIQVGSASTAFGNYRPSSDAVGNSADANGFNDGSFDQEQELNSGWFLFIVRIELFS